MISPLINPQRVWGRLMHLAEIGALSHGGVDRQALTAGEADGWRLVLGWASELGFEPSRDAAGNLFLTLPGEDRSLPPVVAGSHMDTQPTGGKFDGAAGVLTAFEAAQTLAAAGVPRRRDLVVVAWMNEEGCRFAPGMTGSEAFSGSRTLADIRGRTDLAGITMGEELDRLDGEFPEVPLRPLGFPVGVHVELHIEQGPQLEAAGKVIGIVTGMQGKRTYRVTVSGAEGHAGTLAMAERRDALAAFAQLVVALNAEVGGHDPAIKFTIGRVQVEPNAPSVIPAKVTFSIDMRHPDNAVLEKLDGRICALCAAAAPCAVTLEALVNEPSNDFSPALQEAIAASADRHGFPAMPILSFAGHDSRYLARLAPAAMIFIPCRDGISHAESEWAEPAHVAAGAQVLSDVLAGLLAAEHMPNA
ncbi:Zn-dependent hydrolase [Azorhizobium oxalatiphilum]|uniref:Zn-dependent hydrolase n=1 Tax=Azorhizobium oxalatiphilum TaxID=980631 RepID=A0A917FC63_9HYPH|nr:Zn-dependent hydrolase [Azorhizobium oxalatiphilum]GGF61210.1 Zn-dependent hydrolase [Azorhizobium oxalatiphilum]